MKEAIRNLEAEFLSLKKYFSPRIIGEVNDVYIKIAKVKGQDVPWHTHDDEDELFYVIKGILVMELKGKKDFRLNRGELFIVKRGIEHRVHAEKECWLLLVENKSAKHTGDVQAGITKTIGEQFE